MPDKEIEFIKLPINQPLVKNIKYVYYVKEGGKSKVWDEFCRLDDATRDIVITLIKKMASVKDFRSPKIKYNLKAFNYGEIRPFPHRFFFFQKCGNNIIFFDYIEKKVNSLSNEIYKNINKKKERYENEFQKFMQKNRK